MVSIQIGGILVNFDSTYQSVASLKLIPASVSSPWKTTAPEAVDEAVVEDEIARRQR